MDNASKKKLKHEYATLTAKVRRVLKRFTPIDPADNHSWGDDYDGELHLIVSILIRNANREELLGVLAQTRAAAAVGPNPEKDLEIANALIKAKSSETSTRKPEILFRLDLQNDVAAIDAYFTDQVRTFDAKRNSGPGESNQISQIDVGFECSQAGWVAIVFDKRPEPKPDGEWTRCLEDVSRLPRKHWIHAIAANQRGPIELTNINGSRQTYAEESADVTNAIGDLVKHALVRSRDRGLFAQLPLAPGCKIFVEDFDGEYSWPDNDSLNSDNLATV